MLSTETAVKWTRKKRSANTAVVLLNPCKLVLIGRVLLVESKAGLPSEKLGMVSDEVGDVLNFNTEEEEAESQAFR